MKISIITVVYNREETIGSSIASVKSQNFSNIEHIIIDGSSTDNTLKIINQITSAQDKVISEPDNGIYDALNKGFSHSTGDIIGLLHSDDYFASNDILGKVSNAFVNPLIDAVYGDLEYVSKKNINRIVRKWTAGKYKETEISFGWMPPHPTLFLRREVIERWGGFDTQYRISADYDSILRYFVKGKICVEYIPYTFVKMRTGGESNVSFKNLWIKLYEDYKIIKKNEVGGLLTLTYKNLRKLNQFFK